MAFSALNSMTALTTIIIQSGPPDPPTDAYISGSTSNSLSFSFTPSTGRAPSMYYANISSDGINYTLYGNVSSPIIATGLSSNTIYSGTVYAYKNGYYSNTIVTGNGYVMPVGQNTFASSIGSNISSGNNLTLVNNYKQGITVSSTTPTYCLFYTKAFSSHTLTLPNFTNYNICSDTTIYFKLSGDYLVGTKALRPYFSILYNNGVFNDITKTCVIQLYNFNFYNYVNLATLQTYIRTNTGIWLYDYQDQNFLYTSTALKTNVSETKNTSYITNVNYPIYHAYITFNNGIISLDIYNSNVGLLAYNCTMTQSYSYSSLLTRLNSGSPPIFASFGTGDRIDAACQVYDFRVFDRALTSGEKITIMKNN